MARKRYTTGQSVAELRQIRPGQFAQLPIAHQREIVSRLASAANKRLRNLERHGIENAQTIRVQMSGGKFSTRGKGSDALTTELIRAKRFLSSEQTTVKGWKETERKLKSDLENVGISSKPNTGLAYSIYDLLQDYNGDLTVQRMKYETVAKIEDDLTEGMTPQQAYESAQSWLTAEYQRKQDEYEQLEAEFDETPTRFVNKRFTRKRRKR